MKLVRSLAALVAVLVLPIYANAQVSSVTGAVAPRLCTVAQVIALTCSPQLNGLRIVVTDGADATECGNAGDVGLGTNENLCRWSTAASAWIGDGGGPGGDTTAIHESIAGEIAGIAEKASPVDSDWVLIEDSAAGNVKKKAQIGNLPSAAGGDNVKIQGVPAVDPDFTSDGDIDAIRCTDAGVPDSACVASEDVIYRYKAGSIDDADVAAGAAISAGKIQYANSDTLESERGDLDSTVGPVIRSIAVATCASGFYIDINRDDIRDAGEKCLDDEDVYNVTNYGAFCDGVIDDTAAFDATDVAAATGSGIIVIPGPATCILEDWTPSFDGMKIQGVGNPILKLKASATVRKIITIGAHSNIEVTGITFDLNNVAGSLGIIATDTVNLSFFGNTFQNGGLFALLLNGAYENVSIINNLFGNTQWSIVVDSLTTGEGIYISNNHFHQVTRNAISIDPLNALVTGVVIVNNLFEEVGTEDLAVSGLGISTSYTRDVIISNNKFIDTYHEDMHIGSDVFNILVDGNISIDCGRLSVTGTPRAINLPTISDISKRVIVTNNTIYNSKNEGIRLDPAATGLEDVIVSNNIVVGSGATGIKIGAVVKHGIINGNLVVDSTGPGLTINGVGLIVSNNRAYDSGVATQTYGIHVEQADDVVFIGNQLQGNSTGPLVDGGSNTNLVFLGNLLDAGISTLANDATPSIFGANRWLTGGTTTITDFDDGYNGQIIRVIFDHIVTVTHGTNIFINNGANFSGTVDDVLTLVQKADGNWYEVSSNLSGGGGGDSVFIDGVAATDPDFRSEGDLDAIRCTAAGVPDSACVAAEDVIYRYNALSIADADVNASAAIAGTKILESSLTARGTVEQATQAEVDTGTDTLRVISPDTLDGAAMGGELGGTFGAPTVDATHAGSAHHTVFSPDADPGVDHSGLAGAAGIAESAGAISTASGETDFLASGALTCTTAQQGRMQVHTTALQYCDNAATPTLRHAAYSDSAGLITDFSNANDLDADGEVADASHTHTVANLSDTTATAAQLTSVTDSGDADAEHTHDLKANLASPTFTGEATVDDLIIGGELDIGTTVGNVFGAADTTPDVTGSIYWKTNGDDTTFTDFDGAGLVEGDVIFIESASEAGYDCTSSFLVCGVFDMITSAGDVLQWVFDGTNWHMVGRNLMVIEHIAIVIEDITTGDDILIAKAEAQNRPSIILETIDCVARGGSTANLTVTYSICGGGGASCSQADATTLSVTSNDTNFAKSDWDTDDDLISGQWLEFTVDTVTVAPDFLNCDATIRRFYPL